MKFSSLILFSGATLAAALAPPIPPGQGAAVGTSPRSDIHSYLKARAKVDPKCDSKQKKDIKKALDVCRKIAKAAAAAARTGDAARLETYFHTSDQAFRNRIATLYDDIAQECKDGKDGLLTISCDAADAQCPGPEDPNTVAYFTRGTDTVTLCPAALARPVKPKRCGERSLAGVLIHEFSHALSSSLVVDHRYGRFESTQLTRDQALGNADTFQWFAIDAYLNCPAPTADSPPTSEPVAGPSGLCQQHVSKALEPTRAKSKGKKLLLSEVDPDVQQALCTARPADQPPANTATDATRCNEGVSELLQVFDEVPENELSEYLTSEDIVKDMCFEPSVHNNMPGFASDQDSLNETQPPTEPAPELDQSSWPRFVEQVQQQFNIAEQQLRTYLDAGIQSLQDNYPQVYRLLERTFPLAINVLREMATAQIRFTSCLPNKPPSSRRLKARADQDVCKKVLAAIGQPAPAGSPPDKTPPSTTPPSEQKDSEASTNLAVAIGVPVTAVTVAFFTTGDGAALIASVATSLGISTEVGSVAEAVTAALSRVTSSLTQVTRQAVQRIIGRVSRLGHRVANPLLRQITSRALRSATARASERIPLLSFSG
ncbi:deuterolysin metalloprotease [Metarhizium album ARSEF 1941]|uniref:deuterolysin n=1 Tax=Metarhizium album (strain ARSEF 1941) TaxID=1081103 RepID=A0A0B2X4X3_METAS|nr:deuterolysin metalloprotease [Metarhizium album ARSEF 1941]KHO00505.1 deuterolysin metalloprotease [Metarhizium album ARSEF 1941]